MIALDLFAGTGWGIACRDLGITEHGVDNMPAVIETRNKNGMHTPYHDVMSGLLDPSMVPTHDLQIASPPCQTFSLAGGGAGRRALDEVIAAINGYTHTNPQQLIQFGEDHDYRTSLVLAPLAYAYKHMPKYIVWEQVPSVLPVWEACEPMLQGMGYSTISGILQAEAYGVPQTRKRAVLIARRDGVDAHLPEPTHSKYYPRDPERLDPGMKSWISMAEALGFGFTNRPSPTYCNSGNGGAGIEWGGNSIRKQMRLQSLENDRWKNKDNVEPGTNDSIRVSVWDAMKVQTYDPDTFRFYGTKTSSYVQIGNAVPPLLAKAILETII